MPKTRKKASAPRGSRPARGYHGNGRHSVETSLYPSEYAQPSCGIEDNHPRPAGRWSGSRTMDADPVNRFTLAQEAHRTSQQDHSIWNPNSKLRDNPIAFLSAGTSSSHRPKTGCFDMPSNSNVNPPRSQSPMPGRKETLSLEGDKTETLDTNEPGQAFPVGVHTRTGSQDVYATPFFTDLAGQNPEKRAHKAFVGLPSRISSPASSSGDEVLLFRGRKRSTQSSGTPKAGRTGVRIPTPNAGEKIAVNAEIHGTCPQPLATAQSAMHSPRGRGRRSGRRPGRGRGRDNASDDSTLDDYIANLVENGEIGSPIPQKPHSRRAQEGAGASDTQTPEPGQVQEIITYRGRASDIEKSDGDVRDEAAERTESLNLHSQKDHGAESELDDETLAKLFAGQSLDSEFWSSHHGQYPSDSDLSDVQGHGPSHEFDFMNWERPSLQRKKCKKPRAHLLVDGYDSDIEQKLLAAWQSDRLRKKQRKKQREELRSLGMLGQGTKPDDLRAKYPAGMSTGEVAEELRSFLVSKHETLTFPPMDLHARKIIHELANQFKIKSKSTGKADQRRTTLFRTKTAMPYVESTFANAMSRIRRRQLPRPDIKRRRGPNKGAAAGGGYAAASYRDGEIVGGEAAELGTGNRGRAILEKMGWSSGTALGATHNKGILQPVTHTMKRSKAGLG